MKKLLTLIIMSVMILSFTAPDIIKWNEKKLEYADFSIKTDLKSGLIASSCTGIAVKENGNGGYISEAVFDKDKSYVTPKVTKFNVSEVISHEQGHFDITEYICREFNMAISGLTNIKDVNIMYDKYQVLLDTMQSNYDHETEHSLNTEQQEKWDVKMDALLRYSLTSR